MEGQFSRGYKGPGHPHTNMAKAAMNMLTRTSSREMLQTDGILMTSVDTGWITDERPHPTKMRLADEGFHAPLDLVDGAARVYDPIVRGEAGEDLHGCFLKDYEPQPLVTRAHRAAGTRRTRQPSRQSSPSGLAPARWIVRGMAAVARPWDRRHGRRRGSPVSVGSSGSGTAVRVGAIRVVRCQARADPRSGWRCHGSDRDAIGARAASQRC